LENQFNAFIHREPTALAFAVGPTTYLSGLNSVQYDSEPTAAGSLPQARLIAFSLASDVNQMQMATFGGNGTPSASCVATETGASVFASDPPSLAIAGRGSLRLRNITKQLNAGGVVRILRTSSPPAGYDQNSELFEAMEYIRQHPKTVSYSGFELLTTHTWNLAPSNQSKLIDFIPWETNSSPGAAAWYASVIKDQGMQSLFVLIEPNADVNLFEFTICAQYHCRYDSSSQALTNMALPPPTKPLALINAERKHEDSKDSWGAKLGNFAGKVGKVIAQDAAGLKSAYEGHFHPMLGQYGVAANMVGAAVRHPEMSTKLLSLALRRGLVPKGRRLRAKAAPKGRRRLR
jgi:hypothetical protein